MRGLYVFLFLLFAFGASAQIAFNSSFDEQSPVLTPDGSTLYFTIAGHPSNFSSKRDPGDIWFSVRTSNGWSRPQPVPGLNNSAYNAVVGFSSDGRQLFLYGHYQQDGSPSGSQGLSVSNRTGAGWSRPENIYIPYFVNRSPGTGARINEQGTAIVFAAAPPTTYGAEDIYLSVLSEDGWSEPIHLGREINSEYQEMTPFLSSDGKALYFSSNRPGTKGSYDIFKAERLDDTWRNWSKPVPLPGSINSESRELHYSLYNGGVLYTSTRDSNGYGDIRLIPDAEPVQEKIAQQTEQPPGEQPPVTGKEEDAEKRPARGMIRVQGTVVSADKSLPIPAALIVKGGTILELNADEKGYFSFEVPKEEQLSLEADYKGFISRSQKIDLSQTKRQILEVQITLMPATLGTVVTLSNVLFHQSSAYLLEESFAELDVVVTFLKMNPEIRIELAGHTDNRGDRNLNLRLSKERVKKVKSYLESKGIESSRVQGKGYGGSKPVADNKTEEGRRLNRRVEFTIIK